MARARGRRVAFRTFKSLFFRKSHATDQPLFGASDPSSGSDPRSETGLRRGRASRPLPSPASAALSCGPVAVTSSLRARESVRGAPSDAGRRWTLAP